jgi:NADPH2:quinone reductase
MGRWFLFCPLETDLSPAFLKGVSLHMVMQPLPLLTGRRREDYKMILTNIADLVDAGAIKPLIDKKSFNISEVGQAHEHLENGNAIGKVVLAGLA